jgi:hypothetical protein
MADEDVGRSGRAARFQTCAELVPLGRRIDRINDLAEEVANEILRNLGAVLGPVGLHHAGIGQIELDDEAGFLPEVLDRSPELVGRAFGDQPALVTRAFDARVVDRRQDVALLLRQRLRRTLGAYASRSPFPCPTASGTA